MSSKHPRDMTPAEVDAMPEAEGFREVRVPVSDRAPRGIMLVAEDRPLRFERFEGSDPIWLTDSSGTRWSYARDLDGVWCKSSAFSF